ncbi:ATP-binding protein [Streptomyces sp. NBC_00572]|uniref:ATP-binding protein n=1 Tax=Streptomyces sp. NBC_00572 TaxID=2903664 RepID=UPI00224E2818|nr:ATP-binding protein [Streptomyces sp. NBC_00572]MCX4985707.1 ATP-binding protein [Streptomyces sp. NBC_00572]
MKRVTTGERARLTALYGGLLLFAGALLTGVVYFLVKEGLYSSISLAVTGTVPARRLEELPTAYPTAFASAAPASPVPASQAPSGAAQIPSEVLAITRSVSGAAESAALERLLTVSLIVLLVYALLSVVLAWWMAGRVLRPVAVITETARRLSGENLHERIALEGPPGELKRLADTFDGMLGRMEGLVSAQQRFAANAAHELRTPVAVQRAAAEIGLAGEPSPERVARIRAKLIEVADDSERIIEGLLLLAASDQGLRERRPVAVHEVARQAVDALAAEAAEHEVTVSARTGPLTVDGDAVLLDRLVHNLVVNAVRHNVPGGRVEVRTGRGVIEVSNTGPDVPPATVPLLFEPFRRLTERTHAPGEGAGLGLSIVESIARAHDATTEAFPNAEGGGLTVRVRFGAKG